MPNSGIIVAAGLTTAVLVAVLVAAVLRRPSSERLRWAAIALMVVPLQPLVFTWIRLPVHGALRGLLNDSSLYHWLSVLYAPLTEEPAKALVLVVPGVLAFARLGSPVTLAMLIGCSFGIGETWLVATKFVAQSTADIPWFHYLPFISERLMASILHAGMTGVVIVLGCSGRGWALALGAAMVLHLLVNLPIFLLGPRVLALAPDVAAILLTIWILLCFTLASLWLLIRGDSLRRPLGVRVFGHTLCTRCHTRYERPFLLAFNLGARRLERCPHCGSWNWQPTRRSRDESASTGD